MRHFGQVSDYEIAVDIFPYYESEIGFVMLKLPTLDHLADADGLAFVVGDFYTDESEPRDRRLDADGFCPERECQIFFEIFDTRELHALRRLQSILDDGRSDLLSCHLYLHAKLQERPLDFIALASYLVHIDRMTVPTLSQQFARRKIPHSEIGCRFGI